MLYGIGILIIAWTFTFVIVSRIVLIRPSLIDLVFAGYLVRPESTPIGVVCVRPQVSQRGQVPLRDPSSGKQLSARDV